MIDQLGLADRIVDEKALAASVARCRERKVVLPTFAQLADPRKIDASVTGYADHEGKGKEVDQMTIMLPDAPGSGKIDLRRLP